MSIKLDWKNQPSWTFKEIRLYRSLSVIADIALATLVVTLPADSITYTDSTAPMNTVVHYRLVLVEPNDELIICDNQPYGHFPDGTGPGRQDLLRGTWECGYFGTVPVADIYTPDELRTVLGTQSISGAVVAITNAKMTLWHKFVFEGKILFYPQGALISGIRWSTIYNKGWMYGIDGTGPGLVTLNVPAPVAQKTLITKGAFTFRVRTPKGLNKPLGEVYPTAPGDADLIGSEWDRLISSLYVGSHQRSFNIAGLGRLESLVNNATTVELMNLFTITQHIFSVNDISHSRGTSGVPDTNGVSASGVGTYWVPVLQLEHV